MIKYSYMRRQLILVIRSLADSGYQKRVWIDHEKPTLTYEDDFDEAIHFLFDDMALNTRLDQAIGTILQDECEAAAIELVIEALNCLLASVGANATIQDYMNSREWQEVLSASDSAYRVLSKGANPKNLFQDIVEGKHF